MVNGHAFRNTTRQPLPRDRFPFQHMGRPLAALWVEPWEPSPVLSGDTFNTLSYKIVTILLAKTN